MEVRKAGGQRPKTKPFVSRRAAPVGGEGLSLAEAAKVAEQLRAAGHSVVGI